MKKIFEDPYLSLIPRIVVGIIFLLASVTKIANPESFAQEIAHYNIMPYYTLNLFALILPWIELIASIFLITGIRLRANSAIIGVLLLIFIIAVGIALAKGLNIDCGCHTQITSHMVGIQKIVENTIFLILIIYIFFFPVNKFTIEKLAIQEIQKIIA